MSVLEKSGSCRGGMGSCGLDWSGYVGYHGNPVYRAVAWILICVSVTWLPKFLTCGRFPWEAPTALVNSVLNLRVP
jgi:hypothetical protein